MSFLQGLELDFKPWGCELLSSALSSALWLYLKFYCIYSWMFFETVD